MSEENKLYRPDDLEIGDVIREHPSNTSAFLVLDKPAVIGMANKFGKWKLYNIKSGETIYRLLFNDAMYEIIHREQK